MSLPEAADAGESGAVVTVMAYPADAAVAADDQAALRFEDVAGPRYHELPADYGGRRATRISQGGWFAAATPARAASSPVAARLTLDSMGAGLITGDGKPTPTGGFPVFFGLVPERYDTAAEGLQHEEGSCMYYTKDGECKLSGAWSDPLGRVAAKQGDTLTLVHDPTLGSCFLWKNDVPLGLVQDSGLTDTYRWCAIMCGRGDSVSIDTVDVTAQMLEAQAQVVAEAALPQARMDKALPAMQRIDVSGKGLGRYESFGHKVFGANEHVIVFDSGGSQTVGLKHWGTWSAEEGVLIARP